MSTIETLRIMLVEDDQSARATIRAMLAEMGINQVYEAKDGATAKDLVDLDIEMIDMVISDWNMPNFTGMELLKYLRAQGADIPILMVTGRNDVNSVLEAKKEGVTGYIRKPFSMKELESKLKNIYEKFIK